MKKRNIMIDVIKGIGIFLIVLGHTKFFGKNFIYLFHVSIFIVISGFLFNKDKIKNIKSYLHFIKKKIISLYVPYVIVNTIFLMLNNFLININLYSLENHSYFMFNDYIINLFKILCFRGVTELAGASWFLHLLFLINLLYGFIILIFNIIKVNNLKFNLYMFIISIIFILIGYSLTFIQHSELFDIYIITLMCFSLFYFGTIFKKYEIYFKSKTNSLITLLFSFFLLLVLNNYGMIEISKNIYTSIIYFLICSICGWLMIYSLSNILHDKIKKIFSYLGNKSLYILLFHFLGFKITNIIIYLILKDDILIVSKFPTSHDGMWILLYTVLGIIIPLLIYYIFNCLKNIKKESVKI